MNKSELLSLAEGIHEEAYWANNYWQIILQYSMHCREYKRELECSPAFYQIIRRSLFEAMYMCLARIYDNHRYSININGLIEECKKSYALFPSHEIRTLSNDEGKCETFIFPITYDLQEEEEYLFPKEVLEQKRICQEMNIDYTGTCVEVTPEQLFSIYLEKYKLLDGIIKNLRKLRNKRYAHNDGNCCFDYDELFQNAPLYSEDIEKLIHYVFDFCGYVVSALSGKVLTTHPINITDWYATLELTRIGLRYQDKYLDEMLPDS